MRSGQHPQSRREFLAAIGRSAGGTALLRTMAALGIGSTIPACGSSSADPGAPGSGPLPRRDSSPSPRPGDWPANVGNGKRVLVLGGGIAGMTTTLEMQRLGYDCTLLEARPQAGGRCRTLRGGDLAEEFDSVQQCQFDMQPNLYFNPGPSRIPHHHEFLLGYCRELGVTMETFVNDNGAALIHRPGDFGGAPQLARRVHGDTRGHIAQLLATAIDRNALDAELTGADRDSVLRMLIEFGDLQNDFSFAGSSRAGFPGQASVGRRDRGTLLSPLQLQTLAADVFWSARSTFTEALNQQPVMLQPVGGMDRIARAFEAEILGSAIFDAAVTRLEKTSGGVRVSFDRLGSSQALEAEHAVVCIPAPVLTGIPNDFSPAHRAEIAAFRYTSAVRVAFQSPRFWETQHNIYGGISWTDQPITQVWYPSHGFGDTEGIVVGAYIFDGADGDTFTSLPPSQRSDMARTQASGVHDTFAENASRAISVAWQKVPFQQGGWGVSTPDVLLSADERYVFAGEHLSILQGWQEGAILSAYRAIDTIIRFDVEQGPA